MKKIVSIALVLMMVLALATVSFGASAQDGGSPKAVDPGTPSGDATAPKTGYPVAMVGIMMLAAMGLGFFAVKKVTE